MPKPHGTCIYCGSSKNELTKEHVLADWTSRFFEGMTLSAHSKSSVVIEHAGVSGERIMSSIKKIDGDPRARKVRKVCKPCNGGWMKGQQDVARRIAELLISGLPATLSAADQKTLAILVSMTVMVSEFSDAEFAGIPDTDRSFIRAFLSLPANWKIWIGCYPRGDANPYLHHESASFPAKDGSGDDALNTQATTYTVGHLYVHAISSVRPWVISSAILMPQTVSTIRQLWPIIEVPMTWPPPLSLTEEGAESFPGTMYRFAAAMNRRNEAAPENGQSG
jgi:hypothetical protein